MNRDHSHHSLAAGHLPDVFARGDAETLRVSNVFTPITGVLRRGNTVTVTLSTGAQPTFDILDPITIN